MKTLHNIDQTASLIAGIDAPNSTMVIDIDPAQLSPATRAAVMPCYDIASGKFRVPYTYGPGNVKGSGGFGPPAVLANAGTTEAVAALESFAALIIADAERFAVDCAAYEVEAAKKAAQRAADDAAKLAADAALAAEARAGLIDGSWHITSLVTGQTAGRNGCHVMIAGKNPVFILHGDDIAPMIDAYEQQQAEEKAQAEAKAKVARKALYASRLESGEWSKDFGSYNERRYGGWWGATVSFDGAKAVYDFSAAESDATYGNAGTVTIPCKPGDVIAYGQKDHRKANGSENTILFMHADGRMETCTASEARKLQIEFRKTTAA